MPIARRNFSPPGDRKITGLYQETPDHVWRVGRSAFKPICFDAPFQGCNAYSLEWFFFKNSRISSYLNPLLKSYLISFPPAIFNWLSTWSSVSWKGYLVELCTSADGEMLPWVLDLFLVENICSWYHTVALKLNFLSWMIFNCCRKSKNLPQTWN